ncbi:MAG: CoA transferase [Acidimicrobiia bacterium]
MTPVSGGEHHAGHGEHHGAPRQALRAIRVLDVSVGTAGAVATMLLGDFGAEVLAISRNDGGMRSRDPGRLVWDRNKSLVDLGDLDSPGAQSELTRLATMADVIVTDLPPPQQVRLGIDAASIAHINPAAIHVWLPPYGHRDEQHLPASALLLAAASGLADTHTATEDVPVVPVPAVLLYEHGGLGALNAMAGLIRRERTGLGGSTIVSGLQAVAAMLTAVFVDAPGIVRSSKSTATAGPHYRVYRGSDGHFFFLGSLTPTFFYRALDALDLMEVMVLPGVDGDFMNMFRPEVASIVVARLQAHFDTGTRDHWLDVLTAAGIPNAPVLSRDEWLASETVASLRLIDHHEHVDLGPVQVPGLSLNLSATPPAVRHLPGSDRWVDSTTQWLRPHHERTTKGTTAARPPEADALPLEGLRVLDMGAFVAGPQSPSLLRDLGAEVIKVEMPTGDGYRVYSVPFQAINQSKPSVGVDLKHPRSSEVVEQLARYADIVIDNVRPKVRANLGIDAATLHAINPALVRCSITGFGTVGELADTPGFDPLVQARSGIMAAQGGDHDPVFSVMLVHDVATATLAAFGALVAVFDRHRTGRGQEVSLSLASASVFAQSGEFVRHAHRAPAPIGGKDWQGPSPTQHLYQCRDGWIAIDIDPSHGTPIVENAIGVDIASIGAALIDRSVGETLAALSSAQVPAVPVRARTAIYRDDYLAANEIFAVLEHNELGTCSVAGGYSTWAGARRDPPRPIGPVGRDSRVVLRAAGMSDEQIDALVGAGAVLEA